MQEQGREFLLLRPGGAAVEYDLEPAGRGPCEVAVDVQALGAEPRVRLSGRVLVDGREVGVIEPFRATDGDERKRFRFPVESLPAGARLRVEARAGEGGPDTLLRVARVLVLEESHEPGAAGRGSARPTTAEAPS